MAAKPKHVYLISAARKIWRWGPERKAAIAAAMVGKDLIKCAHCKKLLSAKAKVKKRHLYAVDHIEPIVPVDRLSPTLEPTPGCSASLNWDDYLRRMMYGALQILCHPCHKIKTAGESKARREWKQSRQTVPLLRNRRKR